MFRSITSISNPWAPAGWAATSLYLVFIGLPVVGMLVRAAQQSDFAASLTSNLTVQALQLSLLTSAISMAVVVLIGTPLAYLLARGDSTILKAVDAIVELPIVLPPVVAGVAMLMAFGRQGIVGPALAGLGINLPFTAIAVVLAQVFVAAPFFIRAAKLGFQSISREFEEISQTLGVSPWSTFWRLTLPLAIPSILGGLALAWARAISEFGATIMFAGNLSGRTQTMPLAILTAMETDIGSALAMSALLLVGSLAVLALLGLLARRRWGGRL